MGVRELLVRAPRAARVDLSGRRMIVTGTAPGSIGFETARFLAGWGADVVVTTRRHAHASAELVRERIAAEPAHGDVAGHDLDLCDTASVEAFARWYEQTQGEHLDVLVNNAGVHLDLLSQWKAPKLTADGHEIHWRTNFLGTMHLTLRLLPLLRQSGRRSGDARVVNVVSQLHAKGRNAALLAPADRYDSWTAYGNSKLALVHASFELQRRHAASDCVQAFCLHPGAVFTNIADKGLSGNPRLEAIRRACAPVEKFFLLTPEEGAQTSVHCATSPAAPGGRYFRNGAVARASAQSDDHAVAQRIWTEAERWVDGIP